MSEREALVASVLEHIKLIPDDCAEHILLRRCAVALTAQQEPVAQLDLAERIAKKIAPAIRGCDTDTVRQAIRSGILEARQSAPQPDGVAVPITGDGYEHGSFINHETEPHCCGCWHLKISGGMFWLDCNECGELREFTPDSVTALLAAAKEPGQA